MRLLLILLILVLPFVELYLLLLLAQTTSAALTFALVIVTGIVGAAIAGHQGWNVLARLQDELNRGELPAATLVDGAMILVAGALLILPGIVTDLVGLSLLIPPLRRVYRWGLRRWLRRHATIVSSGWESSARRSGESNTVDGRVISGGIESRADEP
jgi:UPF0716 protein FxsA